MVTPRVSAKLLPELLRPTIAHIVPTQMIQPTTSPAKSTPRRKWPNWLLWTGWSLLGLLAGAALLGLVILWFGSVWGVELNPYTLARRSYLFYEIPLIHLQVRGIKREDVGSIAVDTLQNQKYVTAAKGAPDVWHVVTGYRGWRRVTLGDADILVRYLDAQDGDNYHLWVKWSEQNPKLAKVFWPAVSRLAQEEQYVHIPELFDLAEAATDPIALQASLNRKVAELLFELGQRLQKAEDHAEAKKYLDEASQLDPSNPLIKRAAEKSAAAAANAKP
jgi:tetratricopeptide (TPR) repeat protein